MTNTEFLVVLKDFIDENLQTIDKLEHTDNLHQVDTNKMHSIKEVLVKLEQDYFQNNAKEFDEDGNLKKTTTKQVEQGLLKIFNALVEHGEFNIGDCDFDNEKYSTSLCQIADRLLQIESDRKIADKFGIR